MSTLVSNTMTYHMIQRVAAQSTRSPQPSTQVVEELGWGGVLGRSSSVRRGGRLRAGNLFVPGPPGLELHGGDMVKCRKRGCRAPSMSPKPCSAQGLNIKHTWNTRSRLPNIGPEWARNPVNSRVWAACPPPQTREMTVLVEDGFRRLENTGFLVARKARF